MDITALDGGQLAMQTNRMIPLKMLVLRNVTMRQPLRSNTHLLLHLPLGCQMGEVGALQLKEPLPPIQTTWVPPTIDSQPAPFGMTAESEAHLGERTGTPAFSL